MLDRQMKGIGVEAARRIRLSVYREKSAHIFSTCLNCIVSVQAVRVVCVFVYPVGVGIIVYI